MSRHLPACGSVQRGVTRAEQLKNSRGAWACVFSPKSRKPYPKNRTPLLERRAIGALSIQPLSSSEGTKTASTVARQFAGSGLYGACVFRCHVQEFHSSEAMTIAATLSSLRSTRRWYLGLEVGTGLGVGIAFGLRLP